MAYSSCLHNGEIYKFIFLPYNGKFELLNDFEFNSKHRGGLTVYTIAR